MFDYAKYNRICTVTWNFIKDTVGQFNEKNDYK